MQNFAATGRIDLSGYQDQIRRDFAALAVNEEQVTETIRDFYKEFNYVLDPHTAVGVRAAQHYQKQGVPMVCLATAHPAKFGDAVRNAIEREPEIPQAISELMTRETRCELMDADCNLIRDYLKTHARHG